MSKVIVFIRVSTDRQSTEDQKAEMIAFCKSEGYSEENIILIEDQGASAIKLNQKYLSMLDEVKSYVENDPEVDCVAIWHMNRLGRNDSVLIGLKNYFIEHKIQLLCKNPTLKLLNQDKTVNAGAELAYSLFATMVKQDMEEKKAKFTRAKKSNREQGKYSGGPNIKYGYKVDDNGFLVPDPHDSKVVQLIFELYATGKYSNKSLFVELTQRGVVKSNGKPICYVTTSKTLRDTAYALGYTQDDDGRIRNYQPIISMELWEKVEKVRKKNFKEHHLGKQWYLGARLVKCPVCGSNMAAVDEYYKCWQHNGFAHNPKCSNSISVNIEAVDAILWSIARELHIHYLLSINESTLADYEERVKVIDQKLDIAQEKVNSINAKKKKIVDTYLEDLITKEERDAKLVKVDADAEETRKLILALNEERSKYQKLLNTDFDQQKEIDRITDLAVNVLNEDDSKVMYDIVHQHIKKVVATRCTMGEGRKKKLALNIVVSDIYGTDYHFIYVPRAYEKHKIFARTEDGTYQPMEL